MVIEFTILTIVFTILGFLFLLIPKKEETQKYGSIINSVLLFVVAFGFFIVCLGILSKGSYG